MSTAIDLNSDSWKRLSEDERFIVVQAACARFVAEFGDLPKINCISPTNRCIIVYTALPYGTILDDLPTSYEGIPIEQDAVRETMDSYIKTWSMILQNIAGWSLQQIQNYANDKHLCFTSSWAFHDPPMYDICYYLLSEKLQKHCSSGGGGGLEMGRRLMDEINDGLSDKKFTDFPDEDPDYDWDAARERIISANKEMERMYLES